MTKKTKTPRKRIAPAGRRVSNTELREMRNAIHVIDMQMGGMSDALLGMRAVLADLRKRLNDSRGK